MAQIVRLGILGMSEGNGHPYSWSAIFNGYNKAAMQECPFPGIPQYLGERDFPKDGLGDLGKVTHIWTQEKNLSKEIALASNIDCVVDQMEEMIGEVDAILLARDDAQNHYEMALPFLIAGLPVFIDKPLAIAKTMATKILNAQKFQNQVFTCSSLRFAKELQLSQQERETIGEIVHVEASVPKKWDTYAVHVLEPLISQLPDRGDLVKTIPFAKNGIHNMFIEWEKLSAYIKVTNNIPVSLKLEFFGTKGNVQKVFSDSFNCFKASLKYFIEVIQGKQENISREETLEIVKIIENGKE